MERTHRLDCGCGQRPGRRDVSILVVMERTHRQLCPTSYRRCSVRVSILVVMERTHRLGGKPSCAPWKRSFNPCCDGTDSSTRSWACVQSRATKFQSLL